MCYLAGMKANNTLVCILCLTLLINTYVVHFINYPDKKPDQYFINCIVFMITCSWHI